MTCWPLAKLGDHVDLVAGFAFKSRDFTEDPDDVRLLRGANIGQGSLKWEQEKRWPHSRITGHNKFELAVDDIVLAMDRPWIEAGLKWSVVRVHDLPALLVQRVARLRATGSVSQDFLRYLIGSPQFEAYVRPIVTGVNIPHISPTQIREFSFHIPPRQFQDAVAELLRPMDDLIENNRRRIEILEEMARLLYREWFVHFRFPGHEDVDLVDSDLGPIPKGWEARRLGDLLELSYGKALKADDRMGGPISVYGSGGHIGWHDEALVAGPGIVVGRKGNVGSVHWSDRDFFPIDTTYYVKSDLPLRFLDQMLRMQEFIDSHAAVPGLSRDQAYALIVATPAHSLLSRFENVVQPMYNLRRNLTEQNAVLREARDLLLPRLVSGELDVSELDMGLERVGA